MLTHCSLQLGVYQSLWPLEMNIHNEIAVIFQVPFRALRELLLGSRKAEERAKSLHHSILTLVRWGPYAKNL